ncbi:MAG TPA: hypothetical protein PK899_03670, partial [Spirochaetota bacterium]|nr:hypothetical protein [Spirochaetota bacterium]
MDYLRNKELLNFDLNVRNVGKASIESPLKLSRVMNDDVANFVTDDERILAVNTFDEMNKWLRKE